MDTRVALWVGSDVREAGALVLGSICSWPGCLSLPYTEKSLEGQSDTPGEEPKGSPNLLCPIHR